jgi:hypothetical protein
VGGGKEVIALTRAGGMRLPQLHEILEIGDDGAFSMWRSVGKASQPPTPIGRFGGRLSGEQLTALAETARRAAAEGSRTWLISPDSPVDRLEADGASAALGIHDPGEGAWKGLIEVLRPLLGELTASPRAAIALEVDGGARLVHQGTEPLTLDLSGLTVRATHWRDGDSQARWTAPQSTGQGEEVVRPGWRLALPFEHGFDVRRGDRVAAEVTFAAHDGEQLVPVSLQTP